MPSAFDDPREVLEPPTWDELERRLGEPLLSFAIGDADVLVPQGLLSCCHVVHQPHCRHHTALSLVDCRYVVRFQDGSEQVRPPFRQVHDGDVLARPLNLKAAVEAARLMAIATAELQGGQLASLAFDIRCLDLETAEIYRYLQGQREQEAARRALDADDVPIEAIGALPIVLLDGDDVRETAASLMARDGWCPARFYADRVTLLPSEIGHDNEARYITEVVWGQAGDVSPAAAAIVADPTERFP